jgi:hypothetical protein
MSSSQVRRMKMLSASLALATALPTLFVAARDVTPYRSGTPAHDQAEHEKKVAREVLERRGRPLEVTSEARDRSSELGSRAHDPVNGGAIDIRSKDQSTESRHAEAREISRDLGSSWRVVVEEPHRPSAGAEGPAGQVNSTYVDGQAGNVRVGPARATETHTHIQPSKLAAEPKVSPPAPAPSATTAPAPSTRSPREGDRPHGEPPDHPGEFRDHDIDKIERMMRTA